MTNAVYQVLNINGRGFRELASFSGAPGGDQWLIQSRSEDGLNIRYQLCIVQPRGRAYEIKLPREVQEACPHCQGQGLNYVWSQGRSAYEARECPECRGQGSLSYDGEFNLTVSDGLGGRRVIRKKGAGRLNARLGLRGDLILNLTWVEELPSPDDLYGPEQESGIN